MRRPTTHRFQKVFKRHPALDYKPPAYFRALKWSGIAVAALTLITVLYVGYWYYAAGQLRDGVLAWIETRRTDGMVVTYQRLDIGGFPGRLTLRLEKPNLSSPQAPTPWGWEAVSVQAVMRPWSPGRVRVDAAGGHAAWLGTGTDLTTLQGHAAKADGALVFRGGTLSALTVSLADVELAAAGGNTIWKLNRGRLDLTGMPERREDGQKDIALDARLQLGGLRVPDTLDLPLGSEIERLELNAGVLGTLGGGPMIPVLGAWRDNGGTVEIRRLGAVYGPLDMNADGTLALDAALQPIGAFTARIGGFFETVDALRERGIIRARDAVTAKMVLGVLAGRSGDGQGRLTIPLTIQDQTLFAGPVPLIEIPAVIWPGGEGSG